MLAIDEIVNHAALNRPRAIQRVQSRQVFDRVGLVAPQYIAHAMRFKLEDARGQSLVKNFLIGLIVIEREARQIQLLTSRLRNELDGVVKNRECREPEEVHLQQAQLLDGHHVEGGHDFVVFCFVQRDEFRQRPGRDDHASGMHA